MKSILLLSPFFYPEPISTGKYNTILAKELSCSVDELTVACSHPVYPKWVVEKSNEQLEGMKIIRGGAGLKYPSNTLFRRFVLELWFFCFVFKELIFNRNKYSHIVPIFPPSLFMLLVPILCKKATVIGIVHDLQGVYANLGSSFIRKFIFKLIKIVESWSFKACDKLIFLSEDMKDIASTEYSLTSNKIYVHYPFVTIDSFEDTGALNGIIDKKCYSVVYSGALGEKQSPNELGDFMSKIQELNENTKSYIFSQGPEFEKLKMAYPDINFHNLVDEKSLPELLLSSTVQIIPQAPGTSDGSLPSKLPNLLASGCKILCITDEGSELVRILDAYEAAHVNRSWKTDSLVDATLQLIDKKIDINDSQELLDKFRKESLVNTILEK